MSATMRPEALVLIATDQPAPGAFEAIFRALDASSAPIVGGTAARPLVIPIHDTDGLVTGGLWGTSLFDWLHIQMLFVPETLRGKGVGRSLMQLAEAEASDRRCHGTLVDTFSFQAVPFYRKLGYSTYGCLDGFPPGHSRVYLCKRFRAE